MPHDGERTRERRESITNQVLTWLDGARWEDPQRAERVAWKLSEAPERYVSPDPDGDYHEEASRVYQDIKTEYGLRTVDEASDEYQDYEAMATRRQETHEPTEQPMTPETPDSPTSDEQPQTSAQGVLADGGEPGPIDLEEQYWKLWDYTRMVTSGETDALLVEAGPGIGKSYQFTTVLTREVGPNGYMKLSGHCTPVELFHALFEVSDGKVLFIDDIEGLIENKAALALLKQATWSETDERYVEWRSTSSKIECPERFRFKGRVIMCFNEVPEDDKIFDSLEDRCLTYRLHFTYEERLTIMHEVAKADYKRLSYEERREIVEWIEEHSGPADEVNLRLMFHCFDLRSFNPERWRDLAVEQLDVDEETMLVRDLVAKHDTIKAAGREWEALTGKSERTFYRKKKEVMADA